MTTPMLAGYRCADRTRATYERYLRDVQAWLGDRQIQAMTVQDFEAYLATKDWKGSTEHLALAAVKAYLRLQGKREHSLIDHTVRRGTPEPQRAYPPDVMERLIRAVDRDSHKGIRDRAILLLMYDTGLRATEICELLLRFMDLRERVLRAKVKGGRWRSAVFSRRTAEALSRWLEVRQSKAPTVFVNMHHGEPLSREGLQYIVGEWGERLGIKLSPHDLRRSMAVNSLRAGAPAQIVMRQGGWRSPSVFQRYVETLVPADAERYLPTMNGGEQ